MTPKTLSLILTLAVACGGTTGSNDAMPAPDGEASLDMAPTPDLLEADASGPSPDLSPAIACDVSKPFGTPSSVLSVSSIFDDGGAHLSADQLAVYFHSNRTTGGVPSGYNIFVATRASASDDFGAPMLLTAVNSIHNDVDPRLADDGLTIYFASDRPGGTGGYDIYVATRATSTADFGVPTAVNGANGPNDERDPFLNAAGDTLYFRGSTSEHSSGIYRSSGGGATWSAPANEMSLDVSKPVLSRDGLSLFYSRYSGVGSQHSIWVSTRAAVGDVFGIGGMVTELYDGSDMQPTWVSADGCTMYLFAYRASAQADIYVAKRPQ